MSKKTEKEKLQELLDKVQEIRMKQLLTIEEIANGNNKILEDLKERDKELKDVQATLATCPPKEIKRYQIIIKAIEGRKQLISVRKMALKEMRLSLTYLLKFEGKTMALIADYE